MIEGTIFFATYGGGHVAALLPVVERLRRAGRDTCVMAFTTARDAARRAGIDAIGVVEALPFTPSFADAPTIGARLATGQPRHPLVAEQETAAYLGIGYLALERRHGADEAARLWAEFGRQVFLPTEFFEELFTVQRPAAVVATNSPRSERAALEAARNLGIPSVCVVDLYAAFEIEWCGARGYASTVCVLNEEVRGRFIAHGAEPARVVATGNPAFDRLGELDYAALRRAARARLGIGLEERLLLRISQPEPARHPFSGVAGNPDLPVQIDEYLAEVYRDDARTHVLIRLHPSEDRPPAVRGPRIRYGDRSEPLDDMLCACDCVLTCSSTVGVEAALLGVPVVQSMDSIFSPDLPLRAMGMAVEVPCFHDLAPVVAEILAAPRREWPAGASLAGRFGAADRVAEEVLALLR